MRLTRNDYFDIKIPQWEKCGFMDSLEKYIEAYTQANVTPENFKIKPFVGNDYVLIYWESVSCYEDYVNEHLSIMRRDSDDVPCGVEIRGIHRS